MRWLKRQEKIEAEVYEAIDELADELGLKIPYYPTVFWVGRTLKFEDTGLPKRKKKIFNSRILKGESCLVAPRFIFIVKNDLEAIREEASHFVHFVVSQIKINRRALPEIICVRAISEMLGICGAKILGSKRKNNFEIVPDLSRLDEDDWQTICEALPDYFQTDYDFYEFYAYQQGYGLGERLFYQYIQSHISRKFIRHLFLDPLRGKKSASKKFRWLKKRFWPSNLSQAI